MADQPTSRLEGMRAALYCLALLLIAVPLIDWGRGIIPPAVSSATWRFAVVQILSNYLVTPAVGLTIAIGTARVTEHWAVLRGFRYALWFISIAFAAITILFPFDALQAREVMRPQARTVFNTGAATGFIHLALMLLFLLLLSRAANVMVRSASKKTVAADRAKKLVVGT